MNGPVVILAGGGTGGHISPGIAIAERVAELEPAARCVFACSRREVDREMLTHAGAEFEAIPAEGLSLRPSRLVRFVRAYLAGRRAARTLLDRVDASVVVSLGGYVTGPVAAAARARGTPVLLVNLDAAPGKANRLVARGARKVLTACPTPALPGFAERVVGMPVRRQALAPAGRRACAERLALDPSRRTLLVTGASQGATSLNDLVAILLREHRAAFDGWQALHLVGRADPAPVEAAYREAGVPAKVVAFLHDMGLAWGAADLALSRAGANSVAEAILNRVPTVFAPYPYHADEHQRHNAEPYAREGLAALAKDEIDAERNLGTLGAALVGLMTGDAARDAMRAALEARPADDAAREIAREALALARG
jgi:UDP-N-acetylglucosamine--N-acetylmuramyl-(pentapeptide) pyrophosphoryl-undecaprenol N-acetylglucosamine transferase